MPELEKIVDCPQEAVSRLTRSVREDDRYLSILAAKALDDCRDGTRLSREKLRAMDAALRKRVLRAWSAMQGLDEWEFVHLEAVNQLITEGRTGQSVSLPGRFRGTVSKEWFWIEPEDVQKPEPFSYEFHKGMPSLEDAGAGFFLSWDEKEFQAYRDELTKKKIHKIDTKLFISKDIIDQVSLVRSYREGDKMMHGNMHKSLRKLLNEKRIPSNYRERLPLLCHEERILAVPFVGGEGCSTDFNKDKTPLYILVFLPEIQ